MKSLLKQEHKLANPKDQIDVLTSNHKKCGLDSFSKKLQESNLFPLKPTTIDTLQINVGKMCNQVCSHCHVDAGPDRKEIMTRETLIFCLKAIENNNIKTVDLTGGAPEMNPHFKWFVEEAYKLGCHIIVRCNLTIIVANKKYYDLPDFYKKHNVEVVSSLPFFKANKTDKQRGNGVFEKSIKALKMLNKVGYGNETYGLKLNLVYNPSGAFLPGSQKGLEQQFKRNLLKDYGIVFNELFTITNLPISRFLDFLVASGNIESYLEKLVESYNPLAAKNVMCRNIISVGWDGYLYDCDFNQMLELKVASQNQHIKDFNAVELTQRNIIVNEHCFGCTAGAGSSCGGSLIEE